MSDSIPNSSSRPSSIPRVNKALLAFFEPIARWVEEEYFDAEVRGLKRIPDGPALLVGNHNAGVMIPDSIIFYREFAYYSGELDVHSGELDVPVSLAHQLIFRIPLLNDLACSLGIVPASPENARRAFEEGRKVLVYPGGDWEAMRPSRDRDRVDFGGRTGFIRLAMEAGVPIVPVVSAGAHDGWHVLTRGERIARKLKFDRLLRIKVFPIALGLPTGLIVGPIAVHLPLPGKIIVEVLEPICVDGDPEDEQELQRLYDEITGQMQSRLDDLVPELPRPGLFQRLKGIARMI